jgi:hypothetical protein
VCKGHGMSEGERSGMGLSALKSYGSTWDREEQAYQVSAIAATTLVAAIAVAAIHYKFAFGAETVDAVEATCALSMVFGGMVSCTPSCADQPLLPP